MAEVGRYHRYSGRITGSARQHNEAEFRGCLQQWERYWAQCIKCEGEYLEGDNTDL